MAWRTVRFSRSINAVLSHFEPSITQATLEGLEAFLFFSLYSSGKRALETISRQCQQRNVIFADNEQGLLPGSNRLRLKNQEHTGRLGTGKLFQLSMGDDRRRMQEHVSALDTWSAGSYTQFGNWCIRQLVEQAFACASFARK
jgi:hypothetical protein